MGVWAGVSVSGWVGGWAGGRGGEDGEEEVEPAEWMGWLDYMSEWVGLLLVGGGGAKKRGKE